MSLVDPMNIPAFLGGSCESPLGQVPETGRLLNDRFGLGTGGAVEVALFISCRAHATVISDCNYRQG